MTLLKAINKAKQISQSNGKLTYVIEYDHLDSRAFGVCDELDLYTDEFDAYDSEIIEEYFGGKPTDSRVNG